MNICLMFILIIIAKALTDNLVYFICVFFVLASVIYPFFYVLMQFIDAKCRNIFQLENQRGKYIQKSIKVSIFSIYVRRKKSSKVIKSILQIIFIIILSNWNKWMNEWMKSINFKEKVWTPWSAFEANWKVGHKKSYFRKCNFPMNHDVCLSKKKVCPNFVDVRILVNVVFVYFFLKTPPLSSPLLPSPPLYFKTHQHLEGPLF